MATNIKDKIAKLLALAESPNENEAKAALLKARELMAEHKLRPEDVKKAKKEKVIRKVLDITCTAMTNPGPRPSPLLLRSITAAEPTATGAPVARRTRLAWWGWKRTSRLPSEL